MLKSFLLTAFVALTATVQVAEAIKCGPKQFIWTGNKGDICLPKGGANPAGTPPDGLCCPEDGWQWCKYNKICVPKDPDHPFPVCPKGDFDWAILACHVPTTTGPQPTYRSIYKKAIEAEGISLDSLEGKKRSAKALSDRAVLGRRQYKPRRLAL